MTRRDVQARLDALESKIENHDAHLHQALDQ